MATTQRYAHLADEALREASNIFGGILATAAKPATENEEPDAEDEAKGTEAFAAANPAIGTVSSEPVARSITFH